jgi:uncharacterized cupin superfamily protein
VQAQEDDELYIVLDGHGVLEVEGMPVPLEVGQAVFVPAGANHGFTAYEQMSVLVIFGRTRAATPAGLDSAPFPCSSRPRGAHSSDCGNAAGRARPVRDAADPPRRHA